MTAQRRTAQRIWGSAPGFFFLSFQGMRCACWMNESGTGPVRRLCNFDSQEEKHKLLRVEDDVFSRCKKELSPLSSLPGACHILVSEIRRQITVRDLTLAEQADMIVAFRPFSHPDSSEEAGGVGREIQCILQKRSLGRETCRPCLLIIHPDEDERRRRENAFDETWRDENLDSLISGTPEQIESLRADLKRVIVSDLR